VLRHARLLATDDTPDARRGLQGPGSEAVGLSDFGPRLRRPRAPEAELAGGRSRERDAVEPLHAVLGGDPLDGSVGGFDCAHVALPQAAFETAEPRPAPLPASPWSGRSDGARSCPISHR